jgi:hypothetical protein
MKTTSTVTLFLPPCFFLTFSKNLDDNYGVFLYDLTFMVLFSFLCLRFFLICIYRFIQGYMINQRTHYYYVGVKSYKIIRPLYEKRISILILLLIMLVSAAISFINKW